MDDIKKTLVEVFSKVMEISESEISDETNPDNLASWDSLSHVQLISTLEKVFSIEITPDEGLDLESFQLLREFVEKKAK